MKRHSASPIVFAIVTHNTMAESTNLATVSEKLPFLLELPYHCWAESCYLLNSSSISDQLKHTTLNPLVALGHFFIKQKPSLRLVDRNDYETIQLFCSVAKQIFGDGLKDNKSAITDEYLEEIYGQCTKAKSYLLEDVPDKSSRKRAIGCFEQVLLEINEPRKKPTGSLLSNNNAGHVNKYCEDHGSLDWEVIFNLGKAKELFKIYTKSTSAK